MTDITFTDAIYINGANYLLQQFNKESKAMTSKIKIENQDGSSSISVREEYFSGSQYRPDQVLNSGESTERYVSNGSRIIITEHIEPVKQSQEIEDMIKFAKTILQSYEPNSLNSN